MKKINPDYFRNVIFGAEDSLVSTVGVLFGVAASAADKNMIITTGLVVICVEALSMGAGSYLSEKSTHEISGEKHTDNPIIDGIIMYFSYFISGFIPLLPYIFLDIAQAKFVSAFITLIALFLVGYLPKRNKEAGFRMAFVAGAAIAIGFIVGNLAKISV